MNCRDVIGQHPVQRPFIEHDHVLQAVPPDRVVSENSNDAIMLPSGGNS